MPESMHAPLHRSHTRLPSRVTVMAACVALMALSAETTARAQSPMTGVVREVGIDQHLNAPLPLDVMVQDETGKRVPLRQFFGEQPVLFSFVYYRCPMLCTQVLNGVLKSTNAMDLMMGRDYQVVTMSIDSRETFDMAAAKKRRYVEKYQRPGAAEGWHFLTADKQAIENLAQVTGFRFRYSPHSDQFAHGSGVLILTPEGRISKYFYGIDYPPQDVRLALIEASSNRIGTAVDAILLMCYHYDPTTGRYGLAIARLIQVAGGSTVLLLAGFITISLRNERRRLKPPPPPPGSVVPESQIHQHQSSAADEQ